VVGKWLAKEESGSIGDSSDEDEVEVTSAKGDSNPGSGSGNLESGNRKPGRKEDRREVEPTRMDVNMVFTILAEFCAPTEDVSELVLGAECVVFEKPENPGAHMKPLFIRGHLDGTPVGHMLVDGGASVNILSLSLFKKLNHIEGDLKRTNLSLSDFAGDHTEAKGIICKELTVGSNTMPTAFSWWTSRDATMCCSGEIGYTPTSVSHLLIINASSNGSVTRWRWFKPTRMCASP
jgi:hypothetical protein